jgi:hypothetical protein
LVSGEINLPENADFLAIDVYAEEDICNDAVSPELDGHYGDDVVVEVMMPVPVESVTWSRIKAIYRE